MIHREGAAGWQNGVENDASLTLRKRTHQHECPEMVQGTHDWRWVMRRPLNKSAGLNAYNQPPGDILLGTADAIRCQRTKQNIRTRLLTRDLLLLVRATPIAQTRSPRPSSSGTKMTDDSALLTITTRTHPRMVKRNVVQVGISAFGTITLEGSHRPPASQPPLLSGTTLASMIPPVFSAPSDYRQEPGHRILLPSPSR